MIRRYMDISHTRIADTILQEFWGIWMRADGILPAADDLMICMREKI